MPTMTAVEKAELARLRCAAPTTIPAFAEARARRLAELEARYQAETASAPGPSNREQEAAAPVESAAMIQPSDQIHAALKAAIEVETHDYLWTPSDGIDFVPRLCDKLFGDGRALLRLTTINSRPRYYVLRIDSRWDVEDRDAPDGAYDMREALDEIYQVLSEEFGLARDEDEELSAWPAFDHEAGALWRRMSWPDLAGATFEPHPFASYVNLLRTAASPASASSASTSRGTTHAHSLGP